MIQRRTWDMHEQPGTIMLVCYAAPGKAQFVANICCLANSHVPCVLHRISAHCRPISLPLYTKLQIVLNKIGDEH